MRKFPFTSQLDEMDCGPACLKMISEWHGKHFSLQKLRELSHISRQGVSLEGIDDAAIKIGYRTIAVKISYLKDNNKPGLVDFPMPCIAYWQKKHFVVIYKLNKKHVWIADPGHGKIKLKKEQFEKYWCNEGNKGIVLGLEPTPEFFQTDAESKRKTNSWTSLLQYLKPYKRLIIQFMIGIIAGLLFQVIFPFLTQSLIDVGVQNQNINFVWFNNISKVVGWWFLFAFTFC